MKKFFEKYWQTMLNAVVFFGIAHWVVLYTWQVFDEKRFNFVEISFLIHNIVMLALILARQKSQKVDGNIFHQTISMAAFFSGLLFKDVVTDNANLLLSAQVVILFALVLGTISLVNLGRSFGILIAFRKVKTGGLYRIVRHPMYFTDIVWKLGMLLKKPCWFNVGICLFSVVCYVYRATLEETFLSQQPEYLDYMKKVKYRFIPGVF